MNVERMTERVQLALNDAYARALPRAQFLITQSDIRRAFYGGLA